VRNAWQRAEIGKFVESKEAPVAKPTKDVFDPKEFLARLGGKRFSNFTKISTCFGKATLRTRSFTFKAAKSN
jgi:hypothetical protein